MYRIMNSPFGRTFQAIRDNPERCESIGINVRGTSSLEKCLLVFLPESPEFFLWRLKVRFFRI